jgi:anti-sigma factor RsiW
MKCRDVQTELLGRSKPGRAVLAHIEDCDDCRRFRADLRTISAAFGAPVSTPPDLRKQTLARCREMLREKTAAGQESLLQRCRRAFESRRFIAAAGALGFAILITAMTLQIEMAQDDFSSLSVKITILQVAAQNALAAMFLPALLSLKRSPAGTMRRVDFQGD